MTLQECGSDDRAAHLDQPPGCSARDRAAGIVSGLGDAKTGRPAPMTKARSNRDFELVSRFELAREKLSTPELADRLDKPLAFWALPGERRLPLAFMDRPLRELVAAPLTELSSTPGIGRKKIKTLIDLLVRAAQPDAVALLNSHLVAALDGQPVEQAWPVPVDGYTTQVSEASWSAWRETIKAHRLADQPLGRFAPTLSNLPRVIWTTPLSAYLDLSLADMRALKTYGEKRVTAVLDIFAALQSILATVENRPHLAVRIEPRVVRIVEDWISRQLARGEVPDTEAIDAGLVEPLITQVQHDVGEQVRQLADERLGLRGQPASIRFLASDMSLTRARIYQLLDDIQTVFQVRWPSGGQWMSRFEVWLVEHDAEEAILAHLRRAADFFFPDKVAKPARR
jgi:hypothetical protein